MFTYFAYINVYLAFGAFRNFLDSMGNRYLRVFQFATSEFSGYMPFNFLALVYGIRILSMSVLLLVLQFLRFIFSSY